MAQRAYFTPQGDEVYEGTEGYNPALIEEPPGSEPYLEPPGSGLIEEPVAPPPGMPFYPPEGGGVDPYAQWNTASANNPQIQQQASVGAEAIRAAYAAGGMPAVWKLLADNGATPQQIAQMQNAYTSGGPAAAIASLAGIGLIGAGIAQNLLGQTPRTTTQQQQTQQTGTQNQQVNTQQNTALNQNTAQNTQNNTQQNTSQNMNQQTGQSFNQNTGQSMNQNTNQAFNQSGSQTANQAYNQNTQQDLTNQGQTQQNTQQQGTTTPTYAAPFVQNFQQSQGAIQPGAQALFGQGTEMMQALLRGEIPTGLTNLAGAITDPIYADAVRQATEQARLHGFHDSPMSSPVGGAVLSPLLNNAAAQEAQLVYQAIQGLIPGFMNPAMQAGQMALGGLGAVPGLGGITGQTGTATGTQTGSQTGTTAQTGSQTGSQTSNLGGSQTGSLTGSQSGYQSGSQVGANNVQQTGSQTGVQLGSQTGSTTQTGSQTGSQATAGSTTNNVNQTGSLTQPQPSIMQTATQAAPGLTGVGNALTNPAAQAGWQQLWNSITGQGGGATTAPSTTPPPPVDYGTNPVDPGLQAP